MMPTAVTSPLLFGRTNVASPPSSRPSNEGDLDTNMVIILGALLLALVTILGLNSIRRCSRRATVDIYHEAMGHPPPPAGLKKTDLRQIPVRVYKPGPGAAISATDCPICLGEFMDGEQVRVLPKCNHGYHVSCIDTWLMAHSSCPTCRHSLIDQPLPGSAAMQDGAFRSPENEAGRPGAVVVVINC